MESVDGPSAIRVWLPAVAGPAIPEPKIGPVVGGGFICLVVGGGCARMWVFGSCVSGDFCFGQMPLFLSF